MPSERLALQPISLFVLGLPLVGFPETERVADDVERPLPHFDGDAADVLAQNADGDQVQRAEKQDQRHQRGIDRKSTRRTPVTNAQLVCRLLLEKKNINNNSTVATH